MEPSECCYDVCSAATYAAYPSPDEVCQMWLDAGHACTSRWGDVCMTDHPAGAEYNSMKLQDAGCAQCPISRPSSPSPEPSPSPSPCDHVCPAGVCDDILDAGKPECAACAACHAESSPSPSPEPVRESVVAVYSDAGCTEELGLDGFQQSRREFMALPYMPADCVPDAGLCFVLTEACRAAHARRFDHWATEYGGSANVAAIQITSWLAPVPTWHMPADGVPLSGVQASAACAARGERLCHYEELCPGGINTRPRNLPAEHSPWFPFYDTDHGSRRWIHSGCLVHERLGESANPPDWWDPASPPTCERECCDHGWCTTAGLDDCEGGAAPSNGYNDSCKGDYACCEGAPPPTPPICLAETYALTSLAPVSNDDACQLWLDAGYTCDTKWDAVCATDNAYGAEQNSAPLSALDCWQCHEKPICQHAFDYARCAALGMINHYMTYPGEACWGHTCEPHDCCREMPTPDRWTCWYHGDDGDGWRNAGDTASGGTKFCPAGTQARWEWDHHCMGGWCGDFPESECCVRTCWEAGWRDPREVGSGEIGSGDVDSGEGG